MIHELLAAQVKTYFSNPRCEETQTGERAGGQRREKGLRKSLRERGEGGDPSVHVTVCARNIGTIGGTADCGKRVQLGFSLFRFLLRGMLRVCPITNATNLSIILKKKSQSQLYRTFSHWNNWGYRCRTLYRPN